VKEAVIVSVARTPIGKAYRGAFNNLEAPSLSSFAVKAAVERAGINPEEVEDCVWGAAIQEGSQISVPAIIRYKRH
jgi:acetyl-CoA C-acetyltransferase